MNVVDQPGPPDGARRPPSSSGQGTGTSISASSVQAASVSGHGVVAKVEDDAPASAERMDTSTRARTDEVGTEGGVARAESSSSREGGDVAASASASSSKIPPQPVAGPSTSATAMPDSVPVKREHAEGSGRDDEAEEEARKLAQSLEALQPAAIDQRFRAALRRDQSAALMPTYWTPFTSTRDIIDRLLPYHIWDVPEDDLRWALAPPPGEARLRRVLNERRSRAKNKGKGKAIAREGEDEDEEGTESIGAALAAEHAAARPAAMEVDDAATRNGHGPTRKRRRLTASSSAPNQPTEPPDRAQADVNDDDDDVDLDDLFLNERYSFPSLPLAMSYYWSGISLQHRLRETYIRADGAEPPTYNAAPLSEEKAKEEGDESEAIAAPAQNFNITLELLERLAYEEERREYALLLDEWKKAKVQLDLLHRSVLAAHAAANPPPPQPRPQQVQRAPVARAPSSSGPGTPQAHPPTQQQHQQAASQSRVPSGQINPDIPTTPIPLLIPLNNLTQLLAMDINPTPSPEIAPAFRKAILDKPDLQRSPQSLMLAAERVARNARLRRAQLAELLPNPPPVASKAELDALELLSVSPRAAPADQAESALLLGISISAPGPPGTTTNSSHANPALASQARSMPGPDEYAQPSTVMLHVSVVLAKLSAQQLSSLAALMQSLQNQANAQTRAAAVAQGQGQGQAQAQAQAQAQGQAARPGPPASPARPPVVETPTHSTSVATTTPAGPSTATTQSQQQQGQPSSSS